MADTQFKKTVSLLVEEKLKALGFRKRKPSVLSLAVAEDVIGLVGLNKATESRGSSVLAINPVIGVRHQSVERLVAELVEEPFDEVSPFTISANVGYLSPLSKYQPFLFSNSESPDSVADLLVNAVRQYGLPFISSNAHLPALVNTMQSTRFAIQFIAVYRLPTALYLLGKTPEAKCCLDEELAKIASRNDAAAERYRRFANNFRNRLIA